MPVRRATRRRLRRRLICVPRFEPFRALRYDATPGNPGNVPSLEAVTAPPYDVLSDHDVDLLERLHPHNVVHIDVPRERDGAGRYEAAGARLRAWLAEGVLATDGEPSFTLYRQRFTDATGAAREIVGVVGALEVVDEGAGRVLPHERTTPKASTDRLDLTRATRTNLSPRSAFRRRIPARGVGEADSIDRARRSICMLCA